MSLRRHLALSSVAAIIFGVIIILTPTLLFSSQVGYSEPRREQIDEITAPTPAPSDFFKGETVNQSIPPPFIFEFDTDSSYGFSRIYLSHGTFGTPVFMLPKGRSATIVILVSSLSDSTLHVSLERIDGLQLGVTAELKPEILTLKPHEQKELELTVSISTSSPVSSSNGNGKQLREETIRESIQGEFIQLVLKGNGYDLGNGFLLKIN